MALNTRGKCVTKQMQVKEKKILAQEVLKVILQ